MTDAGLVSEFEDQRVRTRTAIAIRTDTTSTGMTHTLTAADEPTDTRVVDTIADLGHFQTMHTGRAGGCRTDIEIVPLFGTGPTRISANEIRFVQPVPRFFGVLCGDKTSLRTCRCRPSWRREVKQRKALTLAGVF